MPLLSSPLLLRLHALTTLILSYHLLFSPTTLLTSPMLTLLGESMRLPPATFSPTFPSQSQQHLPPAVRDTLALLTLPLCFLALTTLFLATHLAVPATLQFTRFKDGAAFRNQVPSVAGPSGGVSRERRGEDLAVLSAGQGNVMGLAVLRVAVLGGLVGTVYLARGLGVERGRNLGGGLGLGLGGEGGDLDGGMGLGMGMGMGSAVERGVLDMLGNQVVFSVALADMLFWGYLWTVIREERREVFEGVQRWRAETGEGGAEGKDD